MNTSLKHINMSLMKRNGCSSNRRRNSTTGSTIYFEKLIVIELTKNFLPFYGMWRLISLFMRMLIGLCYEWNACSPYPYSFSLNVHYLLVCRGLASSLFLVWFLAKLAKFSFDKPNNILVQWLRLAPFKGPNRVDVSLPSPEDGNRSSFWSVVFSSYLEFWAKEKVQKPSNSVIHHRQNPLDSTNNRC
jgi:hypothetical protein